MSHRSLLLPALVVATAPLLCSLAHGRPPDHGAKASPATGEPVVGRIRLRHGTYDLTLTSLRAEGPAHEVANGLAGVMADVAPAVAQSERTDSPSTRDSVPSR